MSFRMVFTARPTKEVKDLLPILSLWHNAFSCCVSRIQRSVEGAAFSEALARSDASVACYGSTEDVFVVPVVVPKHKLIQIERQVLPAHAVIRPNNTALQQRPERFNRIRVDSTANVFASHVRNRRVRETAVNEFAIAARVIGRNQRHFAIHGHSHESLKRLGVGHLNQLANDVPFAGNRTNDGHFVAAARDTSALAAVSVLISPADVRFIHFNDTHKLNELRISKTSTQTVAHVPRRFVRPNLSAVLCTKRAVDLKRGHSLLAGQHQVEHFEPTKQANVRVLKDRADRQRKPIVLVVRMLFADPVERLRASRIHLAVCAARALNTFGPASSLQVPHARFVVREHPVEFRDRHLLREREVRFRHEQEDTRRWIRCQVRDSPIL